MESKSTLKNMRTIWKIFACILMLLPNVLAAQIIALQSLKFANGAVTKDPIDANSILEDGKGKFVIHFSNFPTKITRVSLQGIPVDIQAGDHERLIEITKNSDDIYSAGEGGDPGNSGVQLGSITDNQLSIQIGILPVITIKLVPKEVVKVDTAKLCPVCDAVKISNFLKAGKKQEARDRLAAYETDGNKLSSNPLISKLDALAKPHDAAVVNSSAIGGVLSNFSALSAGSGLVPEAALLDGLANFLVKRFKAEINVWFLNGFREKLDEVAGLKILIPKTYLVLKNSDPYNYPIFIQSFREAFQADLSEIHENFLKLLQDPDELDKVLKYVFTDDAVRAKVKEAAAYVVAVSQFLKTLKEGTDFRAALEDLPDYYIGDNQDVKSALTLAKLTSKGLRDEKGDWVGLDKIAKLYDANVTEYTEQPFWIFWGLMYQIEPDAMKDVKFNGTTLVAQLQTIGNNAKLKEYFAEFQKVAQKGIAAYQEGKSLADAMKENGKVPFEQFDPFVISCLDFVGQSLEFADLLAGKSNTNICTCKNQYLPATRLVWQAAMEAHKKNYALGLANVVSAFDILTDKYRASCNPTENKEQDQRTQWIQDVLKYGNFMVTLANAKTAEDVENALEAAALPVGSYTIKRKNHLTVGLNAWVGPSYARELLLQPRGNYGKQHASISLMAPVGLYFGWGPNASSFKRDQAKKGKWKPSAFVMLSILDMGALVNFRLQDTTASDIPDLTIKNFLAPGVHVGINPFPKAPISIGGYWQYGPLAREVTKTGIQNTLTPGFRFGVWMGVDISIFNFYVKPDSKRCQNVQEGKCKCP
jgi:hypothetical protein